MPSEDRSPLAIVSAQMLLWLLVVMAVYLFIVWQESSYYEPNKNIIPPGHRFEYWGLLAFFGLVAAVVVFQSRRVQATTYKLFFVILSSVMLLALVVFLTGGFLDSPFSGAIALYIGFFVVMVKRRVYPKSNLIFIGLTTLLVLSPYLYLSHKGYEKMHIVKWVEGPSVTWGRLIMSLLLSGAAALIGVKISDAISKMPDDNGQMYYEQMIKKKPIWKLW